MPTITLAPQKQTQHLQWRDATCPDSPTGAHHWIVDTPNLEGMKGRCKWCGTERDYSVPSCPVSIPKHMLQYF